MATEKQFDEEDDNQQAQAPAATTGALAAPPGLATPQRTGGPNTAGRPNIQQYLNANQGAGQKLTSNISTQFNKEADKFNTGFNDTKDRFSKTAGQYENDLGEQGAQKIQTAFKDPNALLNKQQDATAEASRAAQLSAFQKLSQGGYNTDIKNLGTQTATQSAGLKSQVDQLGQRAALANTEDGRFELLRNTFANPNYSQGQQKLDQLFLQTQPGAARELKTGLANTLNTAKTGLEGFTGDATQKLKALGDLSGDRANQWTGLYNDGDSSAPGHLPGLEANLTGRGVGDISGDWKSRQATAEEQWNGINSAKSRLADPNQMTQADLDSLNLGSLAGKQTYGLDLNPYLMTQKEKPTTANIAKAEEMARYNALHQLAGKDAEMLNTTGVGEFSPYSWNTDIGQALDAEKNKWENTKFQEALAGNPYTFENRGGKAWENHALEAARQFGPDAAWGIFNGTQGYADDQDSYSANGTYGANNWSTYLKPEVKQYFTDLFANRGKQVGAAPAAQPVFNGADSSTWVQPGYTLPTNKNLAPEPTAVFDPNATKEDWLKG